MRFLVPLAAVLVLAACGGSSSDGSLSHADLVKRADAICADAHDAVRQLPPARTVGDAAPTLTKSLAIVKHELAQLRALKPAKDDATGYAALLDGFQGAITATTRARDALKANQRVRAQLYIQTALRATSNTRSTAAGLGLKVCSKPAV
jgi:hypothetical protein